jgi:hypothetical protein
MNIHLAGVAKKRIFYPPAVVLDAEVVIGAAARPHGAAE